MSPPKRWNGPTAHRWPLAGDFASDLIYYQPTAGRPAFKEAMASYLEQSLYDGRWRPDPEKLVIGAGCNAVLGAIQPALQWQPVMDALHTPAL